MTSTRCWVRASPDAAVRVLVVGRLRPGPAAAEQAHGDHRQNDHQRAGEQEGDEPVAGGDHDLVGRRLGGGSGAAWTSGISR